MWNFLNIQLIYFYYIYYMFMLVIEENMQMFYVFKNNMLSIERNIVSINLYIKCIDYIVIKILKQIYCQIFVFFFYMILSMRVKMEMKIIYMMIFFRLYSFFNRIFLFFVDLKSCYIGMIIWREFGIMSLILRVFWKFVFFF